MDTSSSTRSSAVFAKLDELFVNVSATSIDTGVNSAALAESKRISVSTSSKTYRKLIASENATSYSKLAQLHSCPRKYELDQLEANSKSSGIEIEEDAATINLDFAFGHAVGAGIQTYATTRSLVASQFAAFIAWKAPWEAEKLDKRSGEATKSLTLAEIAVEKFGYFYEQALGDWEVAVLPSGKPAVELSFAIDMGNGFFHFGHVDVVLRHKVLNKLAVWEGKTTGFESIDEAIYANSNQALGYSVVVDAIAGLLGAVGGDYEVLYVVYSSSTRNFSLLPFGKSRTQRAEWLQDLLLDQASLGQYQKLNFYPKRGESCYSYSFRSRCKWFGNCTMKNSSLFGDEPLKKITSLDVTDVDFKFTLAELVNAQKDAS